MSLPGGTAKLRQEGGTRSVPGKGPGAGSLGQEEEGYAKPRVVRVPSGGERVGAGGGRGSLTLLPEACHIRRTHAALVAPLAEGGLSLPLLP